MNKAVTTLCSCRFSSRCLELLRRYRNSSLCTRLQHRRYDATTSSRTARRCNGIAHSAPASSAAHVSDPPNLEETQRPLAAALAYDLETSHSGNDAQIVDMAVVHIVEGQLSSFQSYVLPTCKINWRAKRVHGLGQEELLKHGAAPFSEVLQKLLGWIHKCVGPDVPIVWAAHNGNAMDHRVFQRSLRDAGFSPPSNWIFWDTLPLARRVLSEARRHSLKHLFMECTGGQQIQLSSHGSLEDAKALAKVWPWLVLQDNQTYGSAPDSFQTYLQWIVYRIPEISVTTARPKRDSSLSYADMEPIAMDAETFALPGIGAQNEKLLASAGMTTVGDVVDAFRERDCNRKTMYSFLKQMLPKAHPIGLHRLLKWLEANAARMADDRENLLLERQTEVGDEQGGNLKQL